MILTKEDVVALRKRYEQAVEAVFEFKGEDFFTG